MRCRGVTCAQEMKLISSVPDPEPDPKSFGLKDPDPKLLISDPEHCLSENRPK